MPRPGYFVPGGRLRALKWWDSVRLPGYREANADIGYKLGPNLSLRVDVYKVTDARADAADYYYTTRLGGEPATGRDGVQLHPLEPRSARVTVTATF